MKDRKIFLVLLAALVVQLIYLFKQHSIWWDSSVYLGMGHYIFSFGKIGIWEPIRPLAWPLILGFFWKLGFNDILFGRLLSVCLSLGAVYMTYLIGRHFNSDSAAIAALLLAFTPIFFKFSFGIFTDIPSVFLALLAIYFFLERKPYATGIFAALAFMTKFPQGMLFIILLILSIRRLKDAARMVIAFSAVVLPYFIFNMIMYKNPLLPLLWASEIVKRAGVWIFSGPWYFYFIELLRQNMLYILAVLGIIVIFKRRQPLLLAVTAVFILYFSFHVHKEARFMLLFLPYMALLAAAGIKKLFRQGWIFWAVAAISLFLLFTNLPSESQYSDEAIGYFKFLENTNEVEGRIFSMHPAVNLYSPKAVEPMYFMVFDSSLAQQWISYLAVNKSEVSHVFVDTCEGGMICPPDDLGCESKKEELLALLEDSFTKAYYAEKGDCEYYVFSQKI